MFKINKDLCRTILYALLEILKESAYYIVMLLIAIGLMAVGGCLFIGGFIGIDICLSIAYHTPIWKSVLCLVLGAIIFAMGIIVSLVVSWND